MRTLSMYGGLVIVGFVNMIVAQEPVAVTSEAVLSGQIQRILPGQRDNGLTFDGLKFWRGQQPAVLLGTWQERQPDRRFSWLPEGDLPKAQQVIWAPPAMFAGAKIFPQQILLLQEIAPCSAIVMEISPLERFAPWTEREFRLTVGWAIDNARAKGIAQFYLLGPVEMAPEHSQLASLIAVAKAAAYVHRATYISQDSLVHAENWRGENPGTMFPQRLSERGLERKKALLAPYLEPACLRNLWMSSSSAPTKASSSLP